MRKCKYNNALIAGGGGFIGHNLALRLLSEGRIVYICDNWMSGNEKRALELMNTYPDKVHVITADISSFKFPCEFDEVYNLACIATPKKYQARPFGVIDCCTNGIMNLFSQTFRCKGMFFQASTSEVYGDAERDILSEDYHGNVNPFGPRSCYDEGKRIAETILYEWGKFYKDIRIVRIFNTYGPYMNIDDGRVVTNMLSQALKDEDITIYGNGSQTRSFQYIDDLIDGILKIMDCEEVNGPVNLGNPEEITIKELAIKIKDLVPASKSRLVYMDLPCDDPKKRYPDISKAMSLIDWEPKIKLDMGLRKTLEHLKTVCNATETQIK